MSFATESGKSVRRTAATAIAIMALTPLHAGAIQSSAPIVQPGAPGEPSRVITTEEATDLSEVGFTDADVRFMQGMISHHAQALEMTDLLDSRSMRDEMHELARRIELSQADEIEMMQEWLRARGQEITDVHAHHVHGSTLMPGMLKPREMKRLGDARGTAFDRLFLELMIQHHEGALVMVEELLSQPGAAQAPEIFAFTSDINADQSMEIRRMRAMLEELP